MAIRAPDGANNVSKCPWFELFQNINILFCAGSLVDILFEFLRAFCLLRIFLTFLCKIKIITLKINADHTLQLAVIKRFKIAYFALSEFWTW